MSETMFVFFLLLTVGGVADWLIERRLTSLLAASTALGACYLIRYEAIAATGAVALCVAGATFVSSWRKGRNQALSDAVANTVTAVLPLIFTFIGFAIASWLITGSPFEQFSSQYGNTAVLASSAPVGTTLVSRVLFGVGELTGAAPLLLLLLGATLLVARGVWAWRALAATAVLGGVLALSALLQASGSTLPFLRFWIAAVPLQVLLGAIVIRNLSAARARAGAGRLGRVLGCGAAVMALVTTVVVSGSATWSAMEDPTYGVQEHQLATVFHTSRDQVGERQTLRQFDTERQVAAYLDRLHLRRGAVLIDVLDGFPLVLASRNPAQFVIPSDRDYSLVLDSPLRHGVQFLLTIPSTGRGAVDAINQRFPGVYDTGGNVATLVLQADADGANPAWRLYQLNAPSH
jgi:hypothetical protein